MELFDKFKKNKEADTAKPENNTEHESFLKAEKEAAEKAVRIVASETKTPCVKMDITDEKPSIFSSKLGGIGYVPHDGKIPEDKMGRQLRLLAQIDCYEVKLEDFPESGLLQFWILNDDVSGLDFDNNTSQDTFRIVYYSDVDRSVTEDEVNAKIVKNEFDDDNMMPVTGQYGLHFTSEQDSMSENDTRFEKMFCKSYNEQNPPKKVKSIAEIETDLSDEVEEYGSLRENAFGHKIGGYPGFTQWDPRDENTEYDFLLLQLDSDFENDKEYIMWGDAGICDFFINHEKLKKLDFSDVIYNWDCC